MHKASHYKMPAGIVMSWLSLAFFRFYGRAIGIPARYKTSLNCHTSLVYFTIHWLPVR